MKQENLIARECSWHGAVNTPACQCVARCFPAPGEESRCPGVDQCNRDLANRIRYANQPKERKK
ncbi:hypothetical protein GZ77_07340 [Endozoicomonas montiporae]|uniref:Uncharacterized protein n=2 Tax=Endozoicomonas montiporae TaxID=1027273 RepID=A0A081N705_9GAMM|nr:hypothetical protein [Endozoicomonas montiporae]AMO55962.1 hypothetical protein EZMO1_1819 [Endozoicomonas montiporae CL-33]KEQ14228.1 hypothetical protein GZ77_07340 [Endozoicomonas montiporae]